MIMQAMAPTERLADFISLADVPNGTVHELLRLAAQLKRRGPMAADATLAGRSVALLFEKPSLRTRTTFEVGVHQLGGHPVYLGKDEVNLGVRETVADVARNLERWVDMVVIRTFDHARVVELAQYAHVPVINALSDHEHPCQALADMLTLEEHLGPLAGKTLAYLGDGNNVTHALLHAAAALGVHLRVATPPGYAPDLAVVSAARRRAATTGATISITTDPTQAVDDAHAVYTDVWASMGSEHEREHRLKVFGAYQVDEQLMEHAAPGALFMHCLPAHRGEEVSAGVMDGLQSVVFDQAENRLHTQKALMTLLAHA
ncbi:MAG TPA: ornithine carbamoyltransferase [Chloroflexota bacterium]|jgi:ornithine carbamoyltransferase|nr:ornithine carbamoyltransferase [Chloroflexota bacterium]